MKESFEKLLDYISPRISSPLYVIDEGIKNNVNEIRLRSQKPVALGVKEKTMFLMKNGGLTNVPTSDTVIAEAEDIEESFLLVCRHSVHSCEEELASSFVTLPCGSRVGISGEAVSDNGRIKSFGSVSSLNYRVPASCLFKTGDRMKDRRLACAVCSDEGYDFTVIDGQAHIVNGMDGTISYIDIF